MELLIILSLFIIIYSQTPNLNAETVHDENDEVDIPTIGTIRKWLYYSVSEQLINILRVSYLGRDIPHSWLFKLLRRSQSHCYKLMKVQIIEIRFNIFEY